MSEETVYYVYGIVRDGFDLTRAPAGLEDTAVRTAGRGGIRALVSALPAKDYGSRRIEEKSGSVDWVSPRAMAHDRVLTWAHDHGGVVPLPMFSMWASDVALSRWLDERSASLEGIFERVSGADEFGVRLHRQDATMLATIHELDASIAELRVEAQKAAPGQRYLLERKIAEQGKAAIRGVSQRLAKQTFDTLSALSRDAVWRPLVPAGSGAASDVTLVLNGAFLVDQHRTDEFRASVASLIRDLTPRGLVFDFTGPWPPYNFVGSSDAADSRSRALSP